MEYVELRNAVQIPQVGLGTWQVTDRDVMKKLMRESFERGYRLIDTAAAYSNEIAISKAINENGIKRSDLILSDKVWNTSRGYAAVQDACKKSLKKLKTDYLDIYLIHWPASPKLYANWVEINAETWRGMESLYKEGLVRAIGVCNFKIHHLENLKLSASIVPMINQIEMHPGLPQKELVEYCKCNDIQVEGSSPLGNGQILDSKVLTSIAEKYRKSVAQICLRWGIQNGIVTIPKTVNVDRLTQNIDVFDFELLPEEMEQINVIPYCGGIGIDSDEVTQFG